MTFHGVNSNSRDDDINDDDGHCQIPSVLSMQPGATTPLLFYGCPMDTDVGLRAVIMKTVILRIVRMIMIEVVLVVVGLRRAFPSPEWIAQRSTGSCGGTIATTRHTMKLPYNTQV